MQRLRESNERQPQGSIIPERDFFTISNGKDTGLAERIIQQKNNQNYQATFQEKERLENARWAAELNERGSKTCPLCTLYSPRRYENPSSLGLTVVSFEDSILLEQAGYGNNPALHSHLAENHPNVLKNVRESNVIRAEYRQKLKDAMDLTERIIHALGNETTTLYRQLSIAVKAEPRYILNKMSQELRIMEQEFSFLVEERKRYIEEKMQEKNKIIEWKCNILGLNNV